MKNRKYQLALEEYDRLARELPETESALKPSIYHNMGTAYAGFFMFDMAARYFKKAYDMTGDMQQGVSFLAAKRLSLHEDAYISFIAEHSEYHELSMMVERKLTDAKGRFEASQENRMLSALKIYKDEGNVSSYYEEIDKIISELKSGYRQLWMFKMGFFKNLFHRGKKMIEPEYDSGNWDEVIYDRDDLQIKDSSQRKEYVKGCLDQIAEASNELENLQFEYNMVTSYLMDMEEIEAIPAQDKSELEECAKKIEALEKQQAGYKERKNRMSEEKFRQMERLESDLQEGYEKLTKAEEYQELIKRDLRKLDGEKQAYLFRKRELQRMIEDTRSMAIVCTAAVILCILILLALQFGLQMNTKIGYLAAAAAGAVAITVIFIKHNDGVKELSLVENGIGRIIRLQNTVKIRYVNNTHLLEYLYMKYNVSSASELGKSWQQYIEEKEERKNFKEAEKELDLCQKELLQILRVYEIKDPMIWLHQTAAILDKKEMVEIRHNLIIRRQSLRRRMDYNKEMVAGKAQAEIKDLVDKYPKYAAEIVGIVEQYAKNEKALTSLQ